MPKRVAIIQTSMVLYNQLNGLFKEPCIGRATYWEHISHIPHNGGMLPVMTVAALGTLDLQCTDFNDTGCTEARA